MSVPQILVLFFILRSLIQFVKKSFVKQSLEWENISAFMLGGLSSLAWDIELLSLGGIPVPENVIIAGIVNFLVIGVAAAEGTGWLHDFISMARKDG